GDHGACNSTRIASAMKPRPSFPARLAPLDATVMPGARRAGEQVDVRLQPDRVATAGRVSQQPPARSPLQARDYAAVRRDMVSRLARSGIADATVLAAMGSVERHRFVDSALHAQAYQETSLPIGLGQTISKPGVVARMIELLRQGAAERLGRVLEIGTGCGYQAAVLSL